VPVNAETITAAIDVGKYNCHWCVCAWWRGAGGVVIDYGVAEVVGNENVRFADRGADMEASEPAIYRSLLAWRDYLINTEYVDAAGQRRQVDMVLCDSGTYTNAVYEFCRQVRGIFRPSKGIANYRPRTKDTANCAAGANQHAQWLESQGVWLQELNTDYWKQWVHERFLTPTFDESNMLRRGSLSLYQPEGNKRHLSYSQHIVAEELTTEFREGKGTTTKWVPKNPNNHWLDATYLAAACTEAMGIQLITPSEATVTPTQAKPKPAAAQSQPRTQHGQSNIRRRPGGWIQGMRRR
jgi:phage terminase large subunit GpA-like protein